MWLQKRIIEFSVQLDLGYPAINCLDISIIWPRSCSVYPLFSYICDLHLAPKKKKMGYNSLYIFFFLYPSCNEIVLSKICIQNPNELAVSKHITHIEPYPDLNVHVGGGLDVARWPRSNCREK